MPEMRAETEREARRKGIDGQAEKPTDPYDLTSMSRPTNVHRTKRDETQPPEADPSGSTTEPDPATHEEHLRSQGQGPLSAKRGG
ncbi:MAG TPA: hypothetical protein VGA16_09270 [Candidatus Limnocylindria bacterium]